MTDANDNAVELAIGLARELPHLRPSQQQQISRRLETPDQVWIFGKAVELALQAIVGESDEVLERVYVLGLEVRQIFDARSAGNLHLTGHWENISPQIMEAFVGGFKRSSFISTLDAVRTLRSREAQSSAFRHVYEIDDVRILSVAEEARPIGY